MATTMRLCDECDAEIPAARLAAMPRTRWCVACAESRTELLGGNMVWHHKTAPQLELKPISEARVFASKTRRHAPTASLGLGSARRPLTAIDTD